MNETRVVVVDVKNACAKRPAATGIGCAIDECIPEV